LKKTEENKLSAISLQQFEDQAIIVTVSPNLPHVDTKVEFQYSVDVEENFYHTIKIEDAENSKVKQISLVDKKKKKLFLSNAIFYIRA